LPTPTAIDYYPGAAASLAMAREAIVLLKNSDGNRVAAPVLPLAANARIAVIGDLGLQVPASPFGTAWSPPSRYVTTKQGLELLNTDNSNITYIPALSLNPAASTWTQADGSAGMKAEYFANTNLAGSAAVTRIEPGIKLDFIRQNNVTDNGTTSLGGINTGAGAFSARFSGTIVPTVSGNHVFKVRADSPFKLYVNDKMVLEFDGKPLSGDVVNALSNFVKVGGLTAGVPANVRLEYRRTTGRFIPALGGIQGVQMSWAALQAPADLEHYDAVVISAGVNAEYEGKDRRHHAWWWTVGDGFVGRQRRRRAASLVFRPVRRPGAGRDHLRPRQPIGQVASEHWPPRAGLSVIRVVFEHQGLPAGWLLRCAERHGQGNDGLQRQRVHGLPRL